MSHYNNGGYQQGDDQQNRPGLADSYYSGGQPEHQQQYSQPNYDQYQHPPPGAYTQGYQGQHGQQDGPDGERGVMGALAGGAAGAFGGHKIGGKTGHNKTSTVIGTIAGAIAGHKLQDAVSDWKDKRDDEKEEEKKQKQDHHDHDHHSSHHHNREEGPHRGNYGGNFTASSKDVRLDAHGDYNLHATCRRPDGSYQHSTISLNRILENDHGSFRWASGGGHHSSGPTTVAVQPGDTLRAIATRFNCSFEEIARHNNISNPDMIYPGQVLQVPGGGGNGGGDGNFGASARNVRLVDGGQRLEAELSRDGNYVSASIVLDERIKNDNGCLQFI